MPDLTLIATTASLIAKRFQAIALRSRSTSGYDWAENFFEPAGGSSNPDGCDHLWGRMLEKFLIPEVRYATSAYVLETSSR